MSTEAVIRSFIDAINAHDVDRIVALCAADHRFVDAHGTVVHADRVRAAWTGYFGFMPGYGIEVEEILCAGSCGAVFGSAWGDLASAEAAPRPWRRPAAWRARVEGERVTLWQVYVDTKVVFDLLSGGR